MTGGLFSQPTRAAMVRQRVLDSAWPYRLLILAIFATAWQLYASGSNRSILIPTFTTTMASIGTLLTTPEVYGAFVASNVPLVIGFPVSIVVGVLVGLAMGRYHRFEGAADPYLSIALVTPLAALIPLVVIALGLGLVARSFLILVFAMPTIIVNARAGVREVDISLIEMSTSFGASERQLWRTVLLPGAFPAIMTGIRLGLGRGITGMVVVELLLVSAGIGGLLLDYGAQFQVGLLYGMVILIILEALVLVSIAQKIETRIVPWGPRAALTRPGPMR